ncbi:MAG: ABC transporter ATP-binding protein [Myxococcales bacterium]|nr:ABC transporter ATP-binding protein [Myxococcales bacterium]
MIEINELTKYYGERKAVGPLSFTIGKGEVVGLLGLNGAGKTTTLRMLSSDLLPTSGGIVVDGQNLVEEPERVRPKIGYLPDRPPLYGEMSVREYLAFAGRLRGMSGPLDRRVKEVIEATDLGEYADERIDTLSHGYRQRVGIAQAIVHRPALLLLDEPISGLDPVQIVEMRELVRSLRGEHTTVLSSHILSEISETCDRLLVIRDGEIVASGSESELSAHMAAAKSFSVTVRVAPDSYRGTPFEGVREVVQAIDGLVGVEEQDAPLGDESAVTVAIRAGGDIREETVKRLVDAGYGVLGLRRTGKDLERVFLELTGKGGDA